MVDPLVWPWSVENADSVTVEAASTIVLEANNDRTGLDLVNMSDPSEPITLGFGNAAIAGSGKVLTAYGSTYHMSDNNRFLGPIYAICPSGGMELAVSEEALKN